jgi:PhnB protein
LLPYRLLMDVSFKPDGWPSVVPRVLTSDVEGAVAFLRSTFGAQGEVVSGRPAEMHIGNSVVLVSDGGGVREVSQSFLYVYVPDTDATCQRAVDAGARVIEAPTDMPYGDRRATLHDPWGNTWQIATYQGTCGLALRCPPRVEPGC